MSGTAGYYAAMRRTQAVIGRARAAGVCPVCGAPSKPWKDGTPRMTCGRRECSENWIRHGGPAPKKKPRRGGLRTAGVILDDPVARAWSATAARVQAGEATLFDLEAETETEEEV